MDKKDLLFKIASGVLMTASAMGLNGKRGGEGASDHLLPEHTSPDDTIETAILELVRELSTGWGVVSEDGGLEKGDGITVLYVDPIDGSYNAVNHLPFFSTSLALFDVGSDEVTHAMVIDIPTGSIYHSMLGSGAYIDNVKLHTRGRNLKDASLSVYIGTESIAQIGGIVHGVERIRYLGCDSLEMCAVAQGSLDGTLHFGRVPRKTDLAASMLIVKESGGDVFSVREDGWIGPCRIGDPWVDLKGVVSLGRPDNIQMLRSHHFSLSTSKTTGCDSA